GGLMLDRDTLDKHIARITRTWKGDSPIVRVVASAKDLPPQAQRGEGWQKAEGYYDGQSKVYLVASNLRNVTRAEHVLAHEAFGHYGVEGIVGKDEWAHIIAQVAKLRASDSLSGDMAAAMASTERRYGKESASTFAREFLAVAAERGVKSTLIGRVLAAVRRWVGKLGINVGDWSEADLRDLVSRGRAAVQDREPGAGRGASRGGAFAEKSPTFYSALKESLDRAKGAPKAADAATWKGWLDGAQRRGEFKGGERQWLGLDEWLDGQKGPITRGELQDFVRANEVQVQDVVLGRDVLPAGAETPLTIEQIEIIEDPEDSEFWVADSPVGNRLVGKKHYPTKEAAADFALRYFNGHINERNRERAAKAGVTPKYESYQLPGGPLARDTEILTRDGWKRIDEVEIGALAMTRRDEDGGLEWQPVEAKPEVYADKLYHFANQSIDMRVTACHKMVVKRRRRSSQGIFRATAQELWGMAECVAPLTGVWAAAPVDTLYGLGAGDVAELVGWYVAEGSAVKRNGRKSTLSIAQSRVTNPEKCARLESLFDRLGIRWNHVASGPAYYLAIRSMPRDLVETLHAQGGAADKFVPPEFFDYPPQILARLLEGLLLGDGNLGKQAGRKSRWTFYSKSKRLADDVQVLALLTGQRASVRQRPSGLYAVRINSKQWAGIDDAKRAIVDYNDTAYCVTVRNHAIYVRTNGVAAFTGNSNYREHLLTLPQAAASVAAKRREIFAKWQVDIDAEEQAAQQAMNRFGSDSGQFAAYRNRVENLRNARDREIERAGVESSDLFRSGHFNEPNILAHVRMNDRTTADGKKALHIEEIQSDWHQRGRRSGYRGDDLSDAETHKLLNENGYEAKHNGVNWVVTAKDGSEVPNKLAGGSAKYQFAGNLQQVAQMVLGRRDLMAGHDAVPQAPMKRTEDWALLGFKHALREAVETGKDKVTWTTGDQQNTRYDLSRHIDSIRFNKMADGHIFWEADKDGKRVFGGDHTPAELPNHVGKEVAEKMIAHDGPGVLKGLDLKVGGPGMRAFYDKMLPDAVNKYVKQWGGKVGESEITTGNDGRRVDDGAGGTIREGGNPVHEKVHSVSITQAMREAVAEGQPLFSRPDKTDTPEFRKWFGESKVVDRAGNPLVVYHGAPDARFMGQDATFKSVHERYGKLGGKRAFWFSDHTTARSYADDRRAFDYQNAEPAVIPAFLKIENPLIVDAGGKDWREAQARGKTSDVIEQAQEGGHDGVIIRNVRDNYNNGPKTKPADTYVVFDSRQIKSATRNSGAFDANNPSILFSRPDTGTADGHDLGDEAPAAEWPRGRNDARRAAQDIKARAKAMTALSRGILQENWATKERNIATADAAVDKFRTAQDKSIGMLRKQGLTGKQLAEAAYADITAHQRGERVTNAATQQFLDLHDKLLADQVARLREADPDGKYLQNLRENYFHQSWKDPKKAAEVFAQLMARRPLTGDKGFTKQRFYQDYQAGIEAGLEPSSLNYVDPFMARYQSGEKLITGLQIKNMLTDKGWVRPIENDRLEQGYARVNDGTFNGVQVPDFVARDLNNYLAPGLSQYQKWRSFRWLQNALLSTRLGFSLFHAGMTTIDSFVSSASLAVRQALRGNMTAALENMTDAAKAIPHTLQAFADRGKGAQLVKQFLGQTASDANTAAVLKFLEAGGARARQHAGIEYNDAWTQAKRAFYRRDPLTDPNNTRGENAQQVAKRLGTTAAAAVEASTRLIQHRLVPAQKMLARYMLAKFELDKAIDKMGLQKGDYAGAVAAMRPDAARQIASRINADVDDRLGQMAYDNLHWNRIVKDALQGSVQSVGWNFGSLRLLLGGIKDIGNIAKPEAITGPLDKAGKVEHYQTGRLTNRLAYLVALNASVALMGAVTQKLLTDEWPTEGKDFFFPKTGRTSSNGSAERVSFPTYVKDEFAYAHHPIETLQHKLHPALSMMSEVMQNRDYYGDRIYDPDGSVPADARDLLIYMAKGFVPYAVQGAVKNKQAEDTDGQDHAGKDAALAAAPFIGITPAPADLSHTPFEQYVQDKYVDTLPQGAKSPEDQAKIDARKEALRAMRSGEEADTSMFSPAQVRQMKREASTPVFQTRFMRLTLPQKLRAYDLATPAERERFGLDRMIARHLAKNVQALPEDERDDVLAKAEAILQQRGEPPPDEDEP
ncbi:MAG: hypothetical protein JSS23_11185, partial [Proteobacteria bacterium]|nr:hypothetical protein [Pseudomonadota bacterium]